MNGNGHKVIAPTQYQWHKVTPQWPIMPLCYLSPNLISLPGYKPVLSGSSLSPLSPYLSLLEQFSCSVTQDTWNSPNYLNPQDFCQFFPCPLPVQPAVRSLRLLHCLTSPVSALSVSHRQTLQEQDDKPYSRPVPQGKHVWSRGEGYYMEVVHHSMVTWAQEEAIGLPSPVAQYGGGHTNVPWWWRTQCLSEGPRGWQACSRGKKWSSSLLVPKGTRSWNAAHIRGPCTRGKILANFCKVNA